MSTKKTKLQLKKRTVANLSNIEMRFVYGGGGDDEGVSQKACDQKDNDINGKSESSEINDIKNSIGILFLTRIFC